MRNSCWCGGSFDKLKINFGNIPSCDHYRNNIDKALAAINSNIELALCTNCNLIQLKERLSPELLYADYIYKTSDSPGLVEHFSDYADFINNEFHSLKNIVDIGCNEGTLLNFLKNKFRYNVMGVEPSDIGVKGCNENRIDVIQDYFNSNTVDLIIKQKGPQEIVCSNNVLANVENLSEYLKNVNKLLIKNGFFIFETITFNGISNSMTIEMVNHEHYYYFNEDSVINLCNSHGFSLVRTINLNLKGGSARYICKKINNFSKTENTDFVKNSKNNKAFLIFHNSLISKKKQINNYVSKMIEKGFSIYGFGAYAGSSILIYSFKLESFLECLFDDNPRRIGLYSPGSALPVKDIQKSKINKKSILIIFAWRYFEQIIDRHSKFIKNFDKIIIPLPKMIDLNKKDF